MIQEEPSGVRNVFSDIQTLRVRLRITIQRVEEVLGTQQAKIYTHTGKKEMGRADVFRM